MPAAASAGGGAPRPMLGLDRGAGREHGPIGPPDPVLIAADPNLSVVSTVPGPPNRGARSRPAGSWGRRTASQHDRPLPTAPDSGSPPRCDEAPVSPRPCLPAG